MSKNFESCHKINWNRTKLAQKKMKRKTNEMRKNWEEKKSDPNVVFLQYLDLCSVSCVFMMGF